MKKILVFLVVILLFACSPAPEPLPEPTPLAYEGTTVYLPVLMYKPYPDCDRIDKLGIAWHASARGVSTSEDLDNFCAGHFFNTSGYDFSTLSEGETPQIWCTTDRSGRDYYEVARTLGADFSDYVILFNEPGSDPSQCALIAKDAAQGYVDFRAILGRAKFVTPNLIIQSIDNEYRSVRYLRNFILEVERLQGVGRGGADFSVIGIHLYGNYETPASVKIKWVKDELCRLNYCSLPIWVTEFGILPGVGDKFSTMSDMVYDVATSKFVERMYVYTIRRTQNSIPFVSGPNEQLTDVGRGYFDGLRRSGYIR